MSRDRKIIVGAVNIVIHPHSPKKYLDLFRAAYRLKDPVHIAGDQYAILSRMHPLDRDQQEPGPITGDIFRFTDIDQNASWFNQTTNQFATEADLTDVNIPGHLKPNSTRFSYIFFPDKHLLFYEGYYDSKTLAPTRVEAFFDRLFAAESIKEKFGPVTVVHIPSVDELNMALKIPYKHRIELKFSRPNPDSLQDVEAEVLKRMNSIEVDVIEQTYVSKPTGSIKPDNELTMMAKISARNGTVLIRGRDESDRPVEYSTSKHPWTTSEYYNPDENITFEIFRGIAKAFRNILSKP